MRQFSRYIVMATSALLSSSVVYAVIPNDNDNTTTFLGPTVKGGYTSSINDRLDYSLAADAGSKNIRLGGTLGMRIRANQYAKVSADYIWQELTYAFFSGNSDQWSQQGALSADYEYVFDEYEHDPALGLAAYLSHAQSKSIATLVGTYVNNLGVVTPFSDTRRVAGSDGAGISPTVSFSPWKGGRASFDLNYDSIRYDKNVGPSEDAIGFGGTGKLKQTLIPNVDLNLAIGVRQPFNQYQIGVAFKEVPLCGRWVVGVDTSYVAGKNTLGNTWNAALSANYYFDQRAAPASRQYSEDALPLLAIADRL